MRFAFTLWVQVSRSFSVQLLPAQCHDLCASVSPQLVCMGSSHKYKFMPPDENPREKSLPNDLLAWFFFNEMWYLPRDSWSLVKFWYLPVSVPRSHAITAFSIFSHHRLTDHLCSSSPLLTLYTSLKLGTMNQCRVNSASTIYATSIFQFGFACLNSLLAIYLLQEVKYYVFVFG